MPSPSAGRRPRPLHRRLTTCALAVGVLVAADLSLPVISAAATYYVDDSWIGFPLGSNPDGPGPAMSFGTDSFATIQQAINAAGAGDTVRVFPGTYNETANVPSPPACAGDTVGLYFAPSKTNLTVQGVTVANAPITSAAAVAATVTTNSNLCFGPDGVFVEADGVTIAGLRIGTNVGGQNKTVEVTGDNFTLKNSDLADPYGSVYLTANDATHVKSYRIEGNLFADGLSLDIASGAGASGPVAGRVITGNVFPNSNSWPAISFSGSNTGVPWFVFTVGGAVIQANTFTNTAPDGQQIRARGTYDNTQFDWASYWNDNSYNKSVVVGSPVPAGVREFSYSSPPYTFNHVRRIGAIIQGEIDHAVALDTVLVGPGTYDESPNIPVSLTLRSDDGRAATTIALQTGPTYLGSLTIGGPTTTVDGFTVRGRDAACPTLATSDILVNPSLTAVTVKNNRFLVGNTDPACANGDDGMGVLSSYNDTGVDVPNLTVDANIFEPLNAAASRVFFINPGVGNFYFRNNQVKGKFLGVGLTNAQSGHVEDNNIDGLGLGGVALGSWSYPDANVWGATTFKGNLFTNLGTALSIFESNDVVVQCNRFVNNGISVRIRDGFGTANFDPTSIDLHSNAFRNSATAGVKNDAATPGSVLAEGNFWNSGTGPNPPGSGDKVLGAVDAIPFLTTLPACIACTTAADCQNGVACDGAESCSAGVCLTGTAVSCGPPGQCATANTCQEPSGSCVPTPKPNGVLCSDGQSCSISDTCQGGICQPGPGGDADHDGDCDSAEAACGCNTNDPSEVCALPNRLVGLPGSGAGEVLLNWYSPTVRKVLVASDPSCQTTGVGLCNAGRCQAGKVPDLCTTDADCYETANHCRVVVNYGDVPDNTLYFARFGRTDVPGFVAGIPTPFMPIGVAAGCSKKVDVLVPAKRSNNLKLKAKGTVDLRSRTDIDALQYRR
jgi:hypothetical protein